MRKKGNLLQRMTLPRNLVNLWETINRHILVEDQPLRGIYCVYSMSWKTLMACSQKEMPTEKRDESVPNAA